MFPILRVLKSVARYTAAGAVLLTISMVFMVPAGAQDEADANPAIALFEQAQDLHEKGDLPGAIALYDKALTAEPSFAEAAYQRGSAQQALGDKAGAERSLRRAVELRADWTLAISSLGALLLQNDQFAEAGRLLEKAVELEPNAPLALASLADLRIRTNASPAALRELLTKITALTAKANPTASLWSARAALETALGDTAAAKKSIAGALAVDPANRNALLQQGATALTAGDIAGAKEAVRRLEDGTGDTEPLTMLKANIAAAEGRPADALRLLDGITSQSRAARDLAARLRSSGETGAADLEKQLEADPRNPLLLGRLCTLYRRDAPTKALEYCRRASEADPANISHAVGFGAALVQAKQFESAVPLLRKLLEAAPDNASVRANLATALFQLKRWHEAKAEFIWLTNAQPENPAAYFFLGIAHDQLNEYMDAMANYQQFLKLAEPEANKTDIERVNLRLPALQKIIKGGKGKKNAARN